MWQYVAEQARSIIESNKDLFVSVSTELILIFKPSQNIQVECQNWCMTHQFSKMARTEEIGVTTRSHLEPNANFFYYE